MSENPNPNWYARLLRKLEMIQSGRLPVEEYMAEVLKKATHICPHCGVETHTPDEECYMVTGGLTKPYNPNASREYQ